MTPPDISDSAHARRVRLAAYTVAAAIVGGREAGLTPRDVAVAVARETGTIEAARAMAEVLRQVASELVAIVGGNAPVEE